MLRLTELNRRVAGEVPPANEVLVNPYIITKVEAHEEHGVDGPCVKVYSDEMPVMVCLGSVAELGEQLRAMEATEAAAEVLAVTRPLIEQIKRLAERMAALEKDASARAGNGCR